MKWGIILVLLVKCTESECSLETLDLLRHELTFSFIASRRWQLDDRAEEPDQLIVRRKCAVSCAG